MSLRVLILSGDEWHRAADVCRGFEAIGAARFDFEFHNGDGQNELKHLTEFSIVVVAKINQRSSKDKTPWLTAANQSTFRKFVRAGGGLFLIHGGTCCKDLPAMRGVAGGAFLSHPEQCVVTVEPKPGHPVTHGVNSFSEKDEHYVMALDATDVDVFLHSRSDHGVQPAGWTRTEGSGRVCALTPGHNVEVWAHPDFRQLLTNSMKWLAKLN